MATGGKSGIEVIIRNLSAMGKLIKKSSIKHNGKWIFIKDYKKIKTK